eukprot:1137483-Pelagomonas_calceolata.AAC.5
MKQKKKRQKDNCHRHSWHVAWARQGGSSLSIQSQNKKQTIGTPRQGVESPACCSRNNWNRSTAAGQTQQMICPPTAAGATLDSKGFGHLLQQENQQQRYCRAEVAKDTPAARDAPACCSRSTTAGQRVPGTCIFYSKSATTGALLQDRRSKRPSRSLTRIEAGSRFRLHAPATAGAGAARDGAGACAAAAGAAAGAEAAAGAAAASGVVARGAAAGAGAPSAFKMPLAARRALRAGGRSRLGCACKSVVAKASTLKFT